MDPLFKVEVITQTPNPQQLMYAAKHQCYCDYPVTESRDRWPGETACGQIAVKRLLEGGREHEILEHPQITLSCHYFPYSVLERVRRYLAGVSFTAQSTAYTKLLPGGFEDNREVIEKLLYLRPVGDYHDLQGKKYTYTQTDREGDLITCYNIIWRYIEKMEKGYAEEHAAGGLPFDHRFHFVMSLNVKTLLNLMDLGSKAHLEVQQLCELVWPHFELWVPEIAAWYKAE